jgi:propionyl-CoA synthetase
VTTYRAFHDRSLKDRDAFWREEAKLVEWHAPFARVLDYVRPPFARWFVDGRTNLCHNAVDRHLKERASQPALVYLSTETGDERSYTYAELHAEVNRMAAILGELGVRRSDRVLIYMPMIPEAAFAMLACVRIGAIHSVVFGGFAAASLATRIDDARPTVLVTADAGMRGGKSIPYKPLVDEALRLARHPPAHVLIVDRGLDRGMSRTPGRDVDYAEARERHLDARVPCVWLESSEPSYILYTSGTTGKPKGVQRDTGGYLVALASSMRRIFDLAPGETMFCTSDIGWVVGHSYIVYAPLINGCTTIMYEGLPIRPDPAIWWKIVEERNVKTMFSSPTAIRVLKKQDPGVHEAARRVVAALAVPRRRAARRADRALGERVARRRDRRQLLADGDRLADPLAQPGVETRRASSAARRSRCTATTCGSWTRPPARMPAPATRPCSRSRRRSRRAA